jgi:integrase
VRRTSRPDQESANHEGLWQKSATPNLYRYRPSGRYFARAKVGGKLIRQSLKTSTYSVAVLRLNDLLKENRGRREISEATKSGPMTFQQAAELLLARVDADPTLKPATRVYRRRCLDALRRTWPDLPDTDVRRITPHQCQDWAADFAKRYSETMYNNTVGTLRMVFDVAVKNGVRFGNPAEEVRKVKVPLKNLRLPSLEQFAALVRTIAERGGRFSRDCANLVEFLAYGGFRKGEAEFIRWSDCDFAKSRIHVAGNPEFGTKNGEVRWVPMNTAMITLLQRLRSERAEEPPTTAVMKIQECQKAMDRACRELGIDRITHHDLRHFFATTCIEAGIDIPTVSRWLGHKDGGALAMRVYGHLRDQHSQAMAQRVIFGRVPAEAPTAPARSTLVGASL